MKKRYYVPLCIFLTGLLFVWLLFPARWSVVRLFEALIDCLVSIAFYFVGIAGFDDLFPATVNQIPDVPFVPFLPVAPEMFGQMMKDGFRRLFVWDNFLQYLVRVSEILRTVSRLLLPCVLIVMLVFIPLGEIADTECDIPGESKALQRLKKLVEKLKKVAAAIKGYIDYLCKTPWLPFWTGLVLAGSNLVTIALAFLSYYFYFSVNFDVQSLYLQLYKFSLDMSVAFAAVPLIFWLIAAYIVYDKIRAHLGLERLRRFECRNAAFLDSLPLVTLITGTMGTNKTKMLTDFTLTIQDNFRRRQLDTMMKIEGEFPWFNWNAYGRDVKEEFHAGKIRSLASAKQYASDRICKYLDSLDPADMYEYDFVKFGREYDDGIVTVSLFDRLIDYARLFYMYNVTCVISGNYSIRVEDKMSDSGNLPLWQNDYFDCPSVEYNRISRHCHVVDFDTLRLGKTVDPKSKVAGAFEFGVVAHTEMGKDYGNSLTNVEFKRSDPTANPKNDMMTARQKLSRHPATVCYYPYYRYIGDDQRPESVGADGRDVMYVLHALSASEDKSVVHIFLFESFLNDWLQNLWHGWFVRYRHNRRDETVPSWLLKCGMKYVCAYFARKFERYVYNVVDLNVEQGTLNGQMTAAQYFLSHKKIHARRYATDCFVDVFEERAQKSDWSLEDSATFGGDVATLDEVVRTNSYFGAELMKIKQEKRGPSDAEEPKPRR